MATPLEPSTADMFPSINGEPSFIERLYIYITTASPTEYIVAGSLLFIFFCLFFTKTRSFYSSRKHETSNKERIRSMFEAAQSQNQNFEIHVKTKDSNKIIASTILQEILPDGLAFETLTHVSDLLVDSTVEVFFRLREEKNTIYYKCHCKILDVEVLLMKRVRVKVSMPKDFTVGQKRNFFRIKPSSQSVRVLALWEQPFDKPIPRTTGEIGAPMFSFTNHDSQEGSDVPAFMPVEDISGSGMGLRIPKPENVEALQTGMQILCLLVYNESVADTKLVTFWCIGKLVNIRESSDKSNALILGLEFSNWAVLEHGKTEIRWFHNSSTSGVGPITQWVMKMNLEQNKRF